VREGEQEVKVQLGVCCIREEGWENHMTSVNQGFDVSLVILGAMMIK
jgi:hypothetical protein